MTSPFITLAWHGSILSIPSPRRFDIGRSLAHHRRRRGSRHGKIFRSRETRAQSSALRQLRASQQYRRHYAGIAIHDSIN